MVWCTYKDGELQIETAPEKIAADK
jgi:hypothetical protein